jgi:hypothetical protein
VSKSTVDAAVEHLLKETGASSFILSSQASIQEYATRVNRAAISTVPGREKSAADERGKATSV